MPFCLRLPLGTGFSSSLRGVVVQHAGQHKLVSSVSIPSIQALGVPAEGLKHQHFTWKSDSIGAKSDFKPSTSPISEASFRDCDYQKSDLRSILIQDTINRTFLQQSMAASSSQAVIRDVHSGNFIKGCEQVSSFAKPSGVLFSDRRPHSFKKASMSCKNHNTTDNHLVFGFFMFDVMRKNYKSNPLVWPWLRDFKTSFSTCSAGGAAPEVSPDGSSNGEYIANSAVLSHKNNISDKTLKLVSGSCYLPHPDKEETGGEDAHFICVDEQAIGVADGVGGWAEVGIDAGKFARELMTHSVNAIREEPKGSVDPAKVLEKAHSSTRAKGSSTACIIALTNQQGIHAINLGDSGFIVVRDGCVVFQSPVQQHGFNFTYQLESGNTGDLPSSGQVFTIPAAPGDVIIAGTDGLFDNLFNNEVTNVANDAMKAGLPPLVTAQKIAALARQRAEDTTWLSPFSKAAKEAGFRFIGGKLDDITVVVSYITRS